MRWILFLLAVAVLTVGAEGIAEAQTIFQQIAGLVTWVCAAILFCGAAIVDAIVDLKREIRKLPSDGLTAVKKKETVQ